VTRDSLAYFLDDDTVVIADLSVQPSYLAVPVLASHSSVAVQKGK